MGLSLVITFNLVTFSFLRNGLSYANLSRPLSFLILGSKFVNVFLSASRICFPEFGTGYNKNVMWKKTVYGGW